MRTTALLLFWTAWLGLNISMGHAQDAYAVKLVAKADTHYVIRSEKTGWYMFAEQSEKSGKTVLVDPNGNKQEISNLATPANTANARVSDNILAILTNGDLLGAVVDKLNRKENQATVYKVSPGTNSVSILYQIRFDVGSVIYFVGNHAGKFVGIIAPKSPTAQRAKIPLRIIYYDSVVTEATFNVRAAKKSKEPVDFQFEVSLLPENRFLIQEVISPKNIKSHSPNVYRYFVGSSTTGQLTLDESPLDLGGSPALLDRNRPDTNGLLLLKYYRYIRVDSTTLKPVFRGKWNGFQRIASLSDGSVVIVSRNRGQGPLRLRVSSASGVHKRFKCSGEAWLEDYQDPYDVLGLNDGKILISLSEPTLVELTPLDAANSAPLEGEIDRCLLR